MWMEHAAAIDVPGMEAAGISLEDYVYYHCRVRLSSLLPVSVSTEDAYHFRAC